MPISKAGEKLKALRMARSRSAGPAAGTQFVDESRAMADSVAELTRMRPGWDEPMRVRGAMRRLSLNPTDEGYQQARCHFWGTHRRAGARTAWSVQACRAAVPAGCSC